MIQYLKGQLYRLRRRFRCVRPEPAVLDRLAAAGILRRRGRRAGRNTQRPIKVIDWTLNHRRVIRQRWGRRGEGVTLRGHNANNLIRPQLMRHLIRPTSSIVCGALNVRSLRNKVEAVDDLVRSAGLDAPCVTES